MQTSGKYILDVNGEPKRERDLLKWARWYENSQDRIVAQETIGKTRVSTVFLGLAYDDLGLSDGPVFWETMFFGGPSNGELRRCGGSREQAEAMHADMVALVKAKDLPTNPQPEARER